MSLSGKRQACGGLLLLYLAAQLLQGLRVQGQQSTPAELRIRLTMAFLPLLSCLGEAIAQGSSALSAGAQPQGLLADVQECFCWPARMLA